MGTDRMTVREAGRRKQIHLAAHFPGVNNTTVWCDPSAGSQIDIRIVCAPCYGSRAGQCSTSSSWPRVCGCASTAARSYDLDVVGRPDTLTVLAALAAVTERIGLAATVNTTFNEPYALARHSRRSITSVDGRAGVERGHLARMRSPARTSAAAGSSTVRCATTGPRSSCSPWPGVVGLLGRRTRLIADPTQRDVLRDGSVHPFEHRSPAFSIAGRFNVPRARRSTRCRSRQGIPTVAGSFAAKLADVIFSRALRLERRVGRSTPTSSAAPRPYGRQPEELKIIPARPRP